ncbi:MAG: hypothetical protein ICV54_28270 [Nostoc sp. C3-bin3]|nr:hypothetical protein [Nostoc sp. C3-bin3]
MSKELIVVFPSSADAFELVGDFLKEKYPSIYQIAYRTVEGLSKPDLHISLEDEVALFSYFIPEINDWVREKGGSDCSFLK